jgi:ribonuclease BN (tRNA processing enzyme)
MELITLGTSSAHPTIERASSGYLVREGDASILIDLGSGAFRNLLKWIDPCELDAIILSHLHQDHFIDIYPLFYYLLFKKPCKLPIDVSAPQGAAEFILRILPQGSTQGFTRSFRFHALADRSTFTVGDMRVKCFMVMHGQPTFGVRISSAGHVMAYSSDTDYTDVLVELAADSDIFVCEATMQEEYSYLKHLTASEAGEIAERARVKKLLLTHIWTGLDPNESKLMAEKCFKGQVIIGEDNMRISLQD